MYGVFSVEDAESLHRMLNESELEQHKNEVEPAPEWYFVKLKQDLPEATNELTGYTQALAQVMTYKNTEDNLDMVLVTTEDMDILVTNRLKISKDEGDVFWVRRIEDEFVPFLPGAGGGGLSADGLIEDVDCPNGTVEVRIKYMSECTDIPNSYAGVVVATDHLGFLLKYTEEQILASEGAVVTYRYNLETCEPEWRLDNIGYVPPVCA